jgi:hypothetical protein
MTFAILVITILTLVFGVLAYFLYKIRESKKKPQQSEGSYEEILLGRNSELLFFKKEISYDSLVLNEVL